MNLRYSILLCILYVSFLGCNSEDDDIPEPTASVAGTWDLQDVRLEGSGSATVSASPLPIPVTFVGNGTQYDMKLVFAENPQAVTALGSFVMEVVVAAAGINLGSRELPIIGSDAFTGTWSQEAGKLTFTGNDNEVSFTIVELTANVLIFEGRPDLRDFGFEDEGIRVNEASFRFVFAR
jgi:hypothetical protein